MGCSAVLAVTRDTYHDGAICRAARLDMEVVMVRRIVLRWRVGASGPIPCCAIRRSVRPRVSRRTGPSAG